MRLEASKAELSRKDIKRGLKLPEKLTPELAEDVGIMVGDGCICFRKNKYDYEISVVGHLITDRMFIEKYVKSLKMNLFGIDYKFSKRSDINTCLLRTYSKGLFEFYTKIIGLPVGSKGNIGIPKIIMDSKKDIKRAFLRGLADTDMTLVFKRVGKSVLHYPTIKINTASKNLILDTKQLLEETGFKPSISCNISMIHSQTKRSFITNYLGLVGKKNLGKWIKEIGFSNPKNILRYELWKENGFSLPNDEIERIMSGPRGTRTLATRV